jgi:defect-in-organelle-trafficking protein DotA
MLKNETDDPLLSQAKFGSELMSISEIFWFGLIGQSFGAITADTLLKALNLGNNSIPNSLLALFSVISITVWGIGALFAIYLPFIPYIIFLVTAIGWFCLVIEAIIAGPILTLAATLPSNDELGKITHGLLLLINIFLRPMLIIIGFILGAKLYQTIIYLINLGFNFNLSTITAQTESSIFAFIGYLVLYAGIIITILNKCFELIYALPDKITRWLGGPEVTTNIGQVLEQTKGYFDKGTANINTLTKGLTSKATENLNKPKDQK